MILRLLLLSLAVVAAGCADDSPSSPSTDLDGVWRIISIQPASQAVQPAPVGARYQVGFEDGRVFLRVDCNTCSGPFAVSGNTLNVGPALACTRAACQTASYESAVVSMMSGAHEMTTTLHNLTLTSTRGTVLLQR